MNNYRVEKNFSFVSNDHHVSLKNKKKYRGYYYFDYSFTHSNCKYDDILCDYYKNIDLEKNWDENELDCGVAGYLIYKAREGEVNLILYKDQLYLIDKNLTEKAIDILIETKRITASYRFNNLFDILSLNPCISLKDKLETRHLVKWNFALILGKADTEMRIFIKVSLGIDINEENKKLFNEILRDNSKWKSFIDALRESKEDIIDTLKIYDKKEELIEIIIKEFNLEHYSCWCQNISHVMSIEFIEKHIGDCDWDFENILKREDLTFEFCKKLSLLKPRYEGQIDLRPMHNAHFITKDLVLNNLDFPWETRILIKRLPNHDLW